MSRVLVCGPESSGTRAVTRLLLEGGAAREPGIEDLPGCEDLALYPAWPGRGPLAVHRSLPYGGGWPSLDSVALAYRVQRLVAVARPTWALGPSQVAQGRVAAVGEADANAVAAYACLFSWARASGAPTALATLDGLADPRARRWLLRWCGLDETKDHRIVHQDWRHLT